MARATKKIFKIKDKRTNKYISLGYRNKATWTVFPTAAIENDLSGIIDNTQNFVIEVFELVHSKTLNLEGKEII